MSLTTQTLRRLPIIKSNLMSGRTIGQIADILRVTEKTVDRDLKAFVESGLFETWIKEEWVRLHSEVTKDNPVEAYRQVSKLLSRMVTRKAEVHSIEEVREIKITWDMNDERLLKRTTGPSN